MNATFQIQQLWQYLGVQDDEILIIRHYNQSDDKDEFLIVEATQNGLTITTTDTLPEHNSEEKDPAPMAKGMSWLKTNFKMAMDESDATIASLITDGCNMGVKSLHMYMNKYTEADNASKDICKRLVSIESKLCEDMQPYL